MGVGVGGDGGVGVQVGIVGGFVLAWVPVWVLVLVWVSVLVSMLVLVEPAVTASLFLNVGAGVVLVLQWWCRCRRWC